MKLIMKKAGALVCFVLAFAALPATARQIGLSIRGNRRPDVKAMALIRGSKFRMGTERSRIPEIAAAFGIGKHPEIIEAEAPQHDVTVSSFYLDKYEVTNAEFRAFVKKNPQWTRDQIPKRYHNGNYLRDWNGTEFPKGKARHPVVNVSWYAAVAYCRSLGKRLPTEAEWEYAARGGSADDTFPWGNAAIDPTRANYFASKIGTTTPVGIYPANGFGLFDMAGNVWEFVADEWGPYPGDPLSDPVAGGNLFLDESFLLVTMRRVIRGGSWAGAPINLRVTYRDSHPPDGAREFVGFRCAKSAHQ